MKTCRHCRVTGRVQGVFYRAGTQRRARELGLTGWANNLPDGSVEVLACGDAPAVGALCDWLWEGPRLAQVDDVQCRSEAARELSDFTTG